jgi:hypothetical protein
MLDELKFNELWTDEMNNMRNRNCQRQQIPYFLNAMKMLAAAIFFMISSASLLAQGQIVVGSVISQLAPDQIWGDRNPQAIPNSAIPDTSIWSSPRQSPTAAGISVSQSSFLTIQAVPEPSSLALSALAMGLFAVSRRKHSK